MAYQREERRSDLPAIGDLVIINRADAFDVWNPTRRNQAPVIGIVTDIRCAIESDSLVWRVHWPDIRMRKAYGKVLLSWISSGFVTVL